MSAPNQLSRSLTPLMLWGLGVGYVISGMYFGWNLGLAEGGTLGLGIATLFIILMYVTFTFSYTELACAIPKAGGVFDYANKAFGKKFGFIAGIAQLVEFIFAPPAIAAAIGAYFHIFFPQIPVIAIAVFAYLVFTALNIIGVKAAASFELLITFLAVIELLIFAGITLPDFEYSNLKNNAFPNGITGIFASIPFAIWFFLGIEGIANVAEETLNPQRNVMIGFGSAIFTLVILCLLTFISSIGVNGWESVVYKPGADELSDSPLPLALSHVVGDNNFFYHLLISIGLLGLIASFHGIILAGGRATFEFGRAGNIPHFFGLVNSKFRTPANALLLNTGIGIIALFTGQTGEIITIACFGALTLYILSMISLFKLRRSFPVTQTKNPAAVSSNILHRPFRVPLFPLFPMVALLIAVIALVSMSVFNIWLALIYFGILAFSYLLYHFTMVSQKPMNG